MALNLVIAYPNPIRAVTLPCFGVADDPFKTACLLKETFGQTRNPVPP